MKIFYLLVYMCTTRVPGAQTGRPKRALNLLELFVTHGCEPLRGYWEVNPEPLQGGKCSKLLSHLQPPDHFFNVTYNIEK